MRYARASQVNWDNARWPNFRAHEFACKCGGRFCKGEYWHDPDFLDRLQAMRNVLGPLVINSGHRCALWNAAVDGAPRSRHKTIAADISLMGHDRHAVLNAARSAGFNGLGLAQTFLHVDRRSIPATWYYGQKSRNLWNS